MTIKSISRKISGYNYDNVTVFADIGEGDDPVKCGFELDKLANDILNNIRKTTEENNERERKESNILSKLDALTKAVKNHEIDDLPF